MSLALAFSKLCVSNAIKTIQRCSQQQFHMTPVVCGEPLKKKKKLDPQIVKARLDRRKRKIEKQIRRLQKNARQLKPIEEIEIPKALLNPADRKLRERPVVQLSEQTIENRELLQKDWSRYQRREILEVDRICAAVLRSHNKALSELRMESEELYQAAIQHDDSLMPFTAKGPVFTPPIKSYQSPDGDYKDVSKKWE